MIDRPIDEVFAFLADGENDPKFSSRVLEIAKTTDGPPGVGTVYASTVKDGGVKFKREFRLSAFDPPTRIRWAEVSKFPCHVPRAATTSRPAGDGTQLTFFNVLEAAQLRGQAHRRLRAALGAQGRRRLRAVDQARRRERDRRGRLARAGQLAHDGVELGAIQRPAGQRVRALGAQAVDDDRQVALPRRARHRRRARGRRRP